jgi:ribosomal protein L32
MSFQMIRSISMALESVGQRFLLRQSAPQLCGMPVSFQEAPSTDDDSSIWFAVPKSKISLSKKKIKNYAKRVFRPKENITTCPRTGEVTLKHKLPFNWKDYIPEFDYDKEGKA